MLEQDNPPVSLLKLAVTNEDIYPKESWNYVFGLANYKKSVGVSSFHRFSDNNLKESNFSQTLSRLIKTSTHEINHMLKIQHCVKAVCLMNGANNLGELDGRPNRLCSECLAKLTWSLDIKLKNRKMLLNRYFLENKLLSDLKHTSQDLEILKEVN
nr:archaemetzincin [Mangrovivirga halotolerans]